MGMTYTTCEVCGREQYCFLQFRTDINGDDPSIIKRAVCPHCLKIVYQTMQLDRRVKTISYYS